MWATWQVIIPKYSTSIVSHGTALMELLFSGKNAIFFKINQCFGISNLNHVTHSNFQTMEFWTGTLPMLCCNWLYLCCILGTIHLSRRASYNVWWFLCVTWFEFEIPKYWKCWKYGTFCSWTVSPSILCYDWVCLCCILGIFNCHVLKLWVNVFDSRD